MIRSMCNTQKHEGHKRIRNKLKIHFDFMIALNFLLCSFGNI